MIKFVYQGRLGNNLIQYAAAFILAKKTGLALDAPAKRIHSNIGTYKTSSSTNDTIEIDFGSVFGIEPMAGDIFHNFIELTDENYFEHLESPAPNKAYLVHGFFQCERLLVDYREEILNLYKIPESNFAHSKNDAFIACRLGDCLVTQERTYCTVDYIDRQLQVRRGSYDKVYITSDTINHPPLIDLIKKYNLTVYQNQPLDTILFASRFKNLILSAGSFSYWMAYFSEATNVSVYSSKEDPLQQYNTWAYNKNVKFINK